MYLLREAAPTFNANKEGGVFLITSSIAVRLILCITKMAVDALQGIAPSGSSMAYSVTKAAGKIVGSDETFRLFANVE